MRQLLSVVVVLLVGIYANSSAFACSPAPDHRVDSLELKDAPECLEINDAYAFGYAAINIVNGCEYDVGLSQSCEGCESLTVLAGGEGAYTITSERFSREEETRTFEVAIDTGEESRTIEADVTWRDNSDACDDWNGRSCSVAASGGTSGFVLFALFLIAVIRRRR